MIQYIEDGEYLRLGDMTIPKDGGNRHYREALEAVARGDAEIAPPAGPTLEKYKATALTTVRAACEAYIVTAYPLTKQLNIVRQGVGYTPEDLEHMNHYIDEARLISNQVETAIRNAESREEIENILTQAEAQYANDLPL